MARIPEETIQQVLASTDIVDVVGRVVKLKRAGTNFVGLCPFHNEKTPSFNVSPSRNSYHCFGCGAGGTPIRFLMEYENLPFVEAVKRLAEAAGIRIAEEAYDPNAEREAKIRRALLLVHQKLAEWYHELLMRHECAAHARAYLKGRGIGSEVARGWQLGYAPARRDLVLSWAEEHGFTEKLLIVAGVLARGERGDVYARLRDRLMFPICSDNGEVIAFSGRLLDPEAKGGKYVNSPETPIFSKSRVLFGFHKSKRAAAKAGQVVVCEGQIDLIMAFESGFENVAAPLGTAFTEHHAKILKRHADEVILCYDSDTAGFKAAEKSFRILAPAGLNVRMATLPKGDDPDSLIRRDGREAFAGVLAKSAEFVDYQIDFARSFVDFGNASARLQYAAKVAENIGFIGDRGYRRIAMTRAAGSMGLPEEEILKLVTRSNRGGGGRKEEGGGPVAEGTDAARLLKAQNPTARMLCRLALNRREVSEWLRQTGRESILADVPGTELLALVWRSRCDPTSAASMGAFFSSLAPEEEQALMRLQAEPGPPGTIEDAAMALEALEVARLDQMTKRIQTQLKQTGLSAEQAAAFQRELLRLRKECLDRRKSKPDTD